MQTTSNTSPIRIYRARRMLAGSLIAVLAGTSLMACADEADDATLAADEDSAEETPSTDGSTSDDAADPAGSDQGQSTGDASSGGSTGGGSTGGGSAGGGEAPAAPAPVIDSFVTPEDIDCHNGMSQMFTASWSTTNATEVTISIDGPGIYDTYGPDGEASLPFNCSSSHTFLLTAHGANGSTATQSVTLQPRNVQTEEPEEEQ